MTLKINGNSDYNQYFRVAIGLQNLNFIYMNYNCEMTNKSFTRDQNKIR